MAHKLLGFLAVVALVALAQAHQRGTPAPPAPQEANIIANSKIEINGKQVPFRGNPKHTALHINVQKDILINNINELVQSVYLACVTTAPPTGGKLVCRRLITKVVDNGLNVIFDAIELTNHMLINGVKLGTPSAKKSLLTIASLLAPIKQGPARNRRPRIVPTVGPVIAPAKH